MLTMDHRQYRIVPYCPEHQRQVVETLRHLWGDSHQTNADYFDWKYEDNPCADRPLGMVALLGDRVVAFRGYFATQWYISGKERKATLLCPGDTCTHPDHRRQGLSVAMGKLAAKSYADQHRVFLNLSATKASLPGYLRLGFVPLQTKTYLTRYSFPGLLKYVLTMKRPRTLRQAGITHGRFADIRVTEAAEAKAMAIIAEQTGSVTGKIVSARSERYFNWRFNSGKHRYLFYYWQPSDVIRAYVVVSVTPNARRGYIVDLGETQPGGLDRLLRFIIDNGHFEILSIYSFSVSDGLVSLLENLRFAAATLVRKLEKTVHGEWPLLVRPIQESCREEDWFIDGIDIRRIENWRISALSSDAV